MRSAVLFLVFNRPDATRTAFASIRRARPPRLYVAADGPRADRVGEDQRCAEARAIATAVDWPCQVQTLFRGGNLGCKRAVAGGIDWFFANEEEGIILEDDVEAEPTFFTYCDELLERYRSTPEVMMISANHFHGSDYRPPTSYSFSRYTHIWGWASWRRAWRRYDALMSGWPAAKASGVMMRIGDGDRDFVRYWTTMFDLTHTGRIDTWDYQWLFATMLHGGLSVTPSRNLARNIGFSPDATHTTDVSDPGANLPLEALGFPLLHPVNVVRDTVGDDWEDHHMLSLHAPRPTRLQQLVGALRLRFLMRSLSSRKR